MDEQSQIQNQVVQKSVEILEQHGKTESAPQNPQKKSSFIFLIFLGLVIFALVFSAIYFLGIHQNDISPSQNNNVPVKSSEVTKQTTVAISLEAPKFDKLLRWSSQPKTATDETLMAVDADKFDDNYMTIPLHGKLYSASVTGGSDPNFIVDNYASQLKSLGWVIPDSRNPFLVFKTFRLRGIIPSGTCGSAKGYLGYKDGMVRIVTIEVGSQTCTPRTQAKTGSPETSAVFTFFISDPTPISYFIDYLAKHSK